MYKKESSIAMFKKEPALLKVRQGQERKKEPGPLKICPAARTKAKNK